MEWYGNNSYSKSTINIYKESLISWSDSGGHSWRRRRKRMRSSSVPFHHLLHFGRSLSNWAACRADDGDDCASVRGGTPVMTTLRNSTAAMMKRPQLFHGHTPC